MHAEPTGPPTDAQLTQIVSLETSLFTAQSQDNLAGDLTAQGANGGAKFLSTLPFSPGMNSGSAFDPDVFTLYSSWTSATGPNAASQQAVARGEMLFNNFPFTISAVTGFNDVQGQSQVTGTCTTCHNTPNVGSNSSLAMMNIGTGSSEVPPSLVPDSMQRWHAHRVPPIPGRAMVTGKCADIGKFKVPGMRGSGGTPAVLPQRNGRYPDGRGQLLRSAFQYAAD